MSQAIETYLDRVMTCANINDEYEAEAARAEQRDHLEAKIEQLEAEGTPREDAVFRAIDEHGDPAVVGYGLRPPFPFLDVRARGTARGVIAIGPKAVGVVAIGGASCGVFALGGVSCGIFTMGGLTAALLCSWGGMACVPLGVAFAGFAIGLVAVGGFAVGVVSWGGMAIGMYAKGGVAHSHYTAQNVPEWMETLSSLVPNVQQFPVINGTLVACMLVVLTASQVPMFKEQRRIEQVLGVRARMN